MFSPLAFPAGSILVNFVTSTNPSSINQTSPFEAFREPLVILGIADSDELSVDSEPNGFENSSIQDNDTRQLEQLEVVIEEARARFPKALVYQLLLFNHGGIHQPTPLTERIVAIPPETSSTTTTTKTVICDVMSSLLAEMNTYAKYLQGLETIDSPHTSAISGSNGSDAHDRPTFESSKRSSQFFNTSSAPRPNTSGEDPRSLHRMSMPAQLPSSNSDQSIATLRRNNQAAVNGTGEPPTTFGEIANGPIASSGPLQSFKENGNISSTNLREHSRERVSISGFGAGSQREKARNKGKGRVGVVVGALYLLAGRWNDALRELEESAAIAKENFDHLWHAKALENMVVCVFMLSWAGLDFQIPRSCLPSERPAQFPPHSNDPTGSKPDIQAQIKAFRDILPDLMNTVMHLYVRTANRQGELLPRISYFECIIRFSKALAIIHVRDGVLDKVGLDHFVYDKAPLNDPLKSSSMRLGLQPTRAEITAILLRAYPAASDSLSNTERISTLAGIAAVFSIIGFHRKKAAVLREMMLAVLSGLYSARKAGAAEQGVHPAAGLTTLKPGNLEKSAFSQSTEAGSDSETGIGKILTMLCKLYGITAQSAPSDSIQTDRKEELSTSTNSDEDIIARISRNARLDTFGNQALKSSLLMTSINLCEALPDFHGVLYFTSLLLQSHAAEIKQVANRDNEMLLATNISRTVNVASRLGLSNVKADYWNEFLLIRIEVLEPVQIKRLMPHVQSDLKAAPLESQKNQGPFFYNPFLKKPAAVSKPQLVVGEPSDFSVTMYNPHDFDLVLDDFKLETKGVGFSSEVLSVILQPLSEQTLTIRGVPQVNGELSIIGGIATVHGCFTRRFALLGSRWLPVLDVKAKQTGLTYLEQVRQRPVSLVSTKSQSKSTSGGPETFSVSCHVVKPQPTMLLEESSLSQSSLMLLEGEVRKFSIRVRNISKSIPINFVLLSFKDSTDGPLQAAMSKRDITSTELYELELMYGRRPAFRWLHPNPKDIYIEPGAEETFTIEVLGKAGLTSALVQVDYGFVNTQSTDKTEEFYTRQLQLAVNLTVNTSIEIVKADCAAFNGQSIATEALSVRSVSSLSAEEYVRNKANSVLMIIDLRNAWPQPLSVEIGYSGNRKADVNTVFDVVQPGHISRLMIPIELIHLSDPFKPIPSLNPSRKTATDDGKILSDAELAAREAFWYREELLKRLHGNWKAEDLGRSGSIEMRNIRLSPRIVDAIRLEDVDIQTSVSLQSSDDSLSEKILGNSANNARFNVPMEEFLTVRARVTNRTKNPLNLLVRMQPSLRSQLHTTALDVSRRLAWSGLMQQSLPTLDPGDSTIVEAGITMLCTGEYEIGAMAEETQVTQGPSLEDRAGKSTAQRRRKIWHARSSCIFSAND